MNGDRAESPIRRWPARTRVVVAGFSAVATGVGALSVYLERDQVVVWGQWSGQFAGLTAVFLATGIVLAICRRDLGVVALLLVRFVLLHIILYPQGAFLGAEYPLAVAFANEIAFYLIPPIASVSATILVVTLVAFQFPMRAWETIMPMPTAGELTVLVFVVSACSVVAILLYRTIDRETATRRANAQLEEAVRRLTDVNVNYQEYARTAERRSSQSERERITRDVHDTIGHLLITLNMMLQQASVMVGDRDRELADLLGQIGDETRSGIAATRRTLYELRAGSAPVVPFATALQHLASNFERITGVTVRVELTNVTLGSRDTEVEMFVYHMVQEAMTNAYKHGRSTQIDVILCRVGSAVRVSVIDNGRGSEQIAKGIGMRGMEERVEALGGSIAFGGIPGGFRVNAEIPLSRRPTRQHAEGNG